mmetsp:Transcript_73598/g.172388  ORF Transcript_73598/g.172388 Transcript_73598/m.172388 type:complete len:353 (-) Transcript_73598:135-1193(-)
MSAAATVQKTRMQDFASGAPIRSVVFPAACKSPKELLSGSPPPGAGMAKSLSGALTFHPRILKPRRSQVPLPEHLRDRVAQTRLLDDALKADCLERLAGAAQRAPMVRRPSWSDVAPPPPRAESDDEEIEFVTEDLFKDEAQKQEQSQKAEEAQREESRSASPASPEVDSVLTPSEPSLPSERSLPRPKAATPVPTRSLTELLVENEHLKAMAELSDHEHFSWRPGSEAAPLADTRPPEKARRRRKKSLGASAKDFYGDRGGTQMKPGPLKQKPSKPFQGKTPSPIPPMDALPPLTVGVEALPISSTALEDARQAILAAKSMMGKSGIQRGCDSLLRLSLRTHQESAMTSCY